MDEQKSYLEYLKKKFPPKARFIEKMGARETFDFEVLDIGALRY